MAAEEGHRDQRDGLDAAALLPSAAASDSEALGAQREDATTVNNEDADDTAAQNETQWQKFRGFCDRNIGLVFVLFAQMFASIMAMTTRLLETGFDTKFHALQVIFVRMIATATISSAYMLWKKTPDFPLGPPGVRGLLVLRGLAGSAGLFGLYYSLSYLDISDATVITFLVPTLTAFVCWVALREPFTVKEALAGLIAFIGVLFVARPTFLFPYYGKHDSDTTQQDSSGGGGLLPPAEATPAERAIAIVCAVFGSFCAASAYATIRVIGKRVHSLVSVNYFAVMATVSSALIILIHPGLQFEIPQTTTQWILLVSIGISGFLLQVLLTEGLRREKAGRATNLIYTQIIFALIIERVVWGTTPPVESLIGSLLIIGAAVWVSLQKNKTPPAEETRKPTPDEESPLLGSGDQTASSRE